MNLSIPVRYESTNSLYQASVWLNLLPSPFSADFEVSSEVTKEQREFYKQKMEEEKDGNLYHHCRRMFLSNGLSHPVYTEITHLSVAWSESDAKVIICDSWQLRNLVCNFLTRTDKLQLWHNACYDLRILYYHTRLFPRRFLDTQLLAKCYLNDANSAYGDTSLKTLMAYAYGDWAISKDNFTLEEMHDPNMIRYSATDACATYKLYTDIINDTK